MTKAHMNSQRLKQLHVSIPVPLCIDYSLQFSFCTELLSVSEWISDFVPFLGTFLLLLVFFIQCYCDGFVLFYYILFYYILLSLRSLYIWHRRWVYYNRRVDEEELGGVDGRKTVIWIYCLRKKIIFNKIEKRFESAINLVHSEFQEFVSINSIYAKSNIWI